MTAPSPLQPQAPLQLSRRERQIMEIVYQQGRASVSDVREAMPDAPSYSAVRAMLRLLEEKGHLKHKQEGRKYVFSPTVATTTIRTSALVNVLQTFFQGSVEDAVASLLDLDTPALSDQEFDRLSNLIQEAKKKGNPA